MIQKFTLESHHDRLLLQGLLVLPEQEPPRAVFQVAHGMCEHKERYLPFLQEMADHGYVCVIPRSPWPRRQCASDGGSGILLSGRRSGAGVRSVPGDTLDTGTVPGTAAVPVRTQHGFPGSTLLSKRYPDVPDGVFVCGSPSAAFGLELGERVRAVLARKRAHPTRASGWRMLSFPDSRNRSGMRAGDNAWICSDPAVVDAYNADPLCTFCFTLNGYEALLYLLRTAYSETEWRVTKPELPIRFLSGADYPCRGNDEKFAQAAQLLPAGGLSERVVPAVSGNAARDIERNRKIAGVP